MIIAHLVRGMSNMKSREEIVNKAVSDYNAKHNSDENWIKSRVNGAWNSGFKNGYAFAKDEMQENIIAELQRAYNEGWNAGYSFANNEKSNTVVRNEIERVII